MIYWYNQPDNAPNPINTQSFWASTEWPTCPESCLPMIYVSGVLPQKRSLILCLTHWPGICPSLDSAETVYSKNTGDIKLNNTLACNLCGSRNNTVMFIHVRNPQKNAPVWHTSSALYLPAPTYIGDKENSMPPLFHVSAWICVHVWSLSNLAWKVDWHEQNLSLCVIVLERSDELLSVYCYIYLLSTFGIVWYGKS